MWVIPQWQVRATRSDPPEGGSDIARPAHVVLDVSDGDLEVILKTLKQNGYDQLQAIRQEPFPVVPLQVATD